MSLNTKRIRWARWLLRDVRLAEQLLERDLLQPSTRQTLSDAIKRLQSYADEGEKLLRPRRVGHDPTLDMLRDELRDAVQSARVLREQALGALRLTREPAAFDIGQAYLHPAAATLADRPTSPVEGDVVYVESESAMFVATKHGWVMMGGAA